MIPMGCISYVKICYFWWIFNIIFSSIIPECSSSTGIGKELTRQEIASYRQRVKSMFSFAYEKYLEYAADYDELQPLSCQGMDTWGSFSLTLIDSLDTLLILGNKTEFNRVSQFILDNINFDHDVNVSVFETNIRVVGGLLSAHLLQSHALPIQELHPGWPCSGPLLKLAEDVARRLLPAFNTPTGMPYGTVNLKYGVPFNETPITCTAGVGTFLVEFATLSRLTGDPIFESVARKAIQSLHSTRSTLNLLGNHINTTNGQWTALDASIGAGVDSYFEYLVKGSMLLHDPSLMDMFYTYYEAINRHMKKDDWFVMVHKDSGHVTIPLFQSLESFWPGLLSLIGQIDAGKKSLYNYFTLVKEYGFIPEMYDISTRSLKRSGYPLRPEFVESLFYLYRATADPILLTMAAQVIESIESSCKTSCGYATVKDVQTHLLEDRMESFFLSETLKYLYLLFAEEDHFMLNTGSTGRVINVQGFSCVIDAGGYIFNTEAHPVDVAALDCCASKWQTLEHISAGQRANQNIPPNSIFNDVCVVPSTLNQFWSIVNYKDDDGEYEDELLNKEHSCLYQRNMACDFDLLACPMESLVSRFAHYGQVGSRA